MKEVKNTVLSWVAQLVEGSRLLILAQVMIPGSWDPAADQAPSWVWSLPEILSVSLPLPLSPTHALFQKKKKKDKDKKKKKKILSSSYWCPTLQQQKLHTPYLKYNKSSELNILPKVTRSISS